MKAIDVLKEKFPATYDIYKMIGDNYDNGIVGAGVLYKPPGHKEVNYVTGYYSCVLIFKGEGYYTDENGVINLNKGSLLQRAPMKVHSAFCSEGTGWAEVFIAFGKEIYDSLKNMGLILEKPVLTIGINDELIEKWMDIINYLRVADSKELPKVLTKVIDFVIMVNEIEKSREEKALSPFLLSAFKYINENIEKNIKAEDVALHLNMSYERFRKKFKDEAKISPNHYIIEERIKIAKYLLVYTEVSIEEIAERLLYCDCAFFSKQFKRFTKKTPLEFRKANERGELM